MSNKTKCFALGLLRILGGLVALALAVCVFNVIGYLTYPLSPNFWEYSTGLLKGDTYLGRAFKLAVIGFLNSTLCVGVAGLLYLLLPNLYRASSLALRIALAKTYAGILYIGGYREAEGDACRTPRERT
jgi:hypothetical protein